MPASRRTTISIPTQHLPEVESFLGYLQYRDNTLPEATAPTSVPSEAGDADFPLWPDEDVVALTNVNTTTARNYITIMNTIIDAGKVGEWQSITQLAEMTGINRSEISTFRTHLYRYIHKVHGTKVRSPFTAIWGPNLTPRRGRVMFYRISAECAEQWKRIGAR